MMQKMAYIGAKGVGVKRRDVPKVAVITQPQSYVKRGVYGNYIIYHQAETNYAPVLKAKRLLFILLSFRHIFRPFSQKSILNMRWHTP